MDGDGQSLMGSSNSQVIVSIAAAEAAMAAQRGNDSSRNSTGATTSSEGFGIKSPTKVSKEDPLSTQMSPEITRASPISTPNRPPKVPNASLTRRVSLARSAFSKPKSRLVEPHYPTSDLVVVEETNQATVLTSTSPYRNSPKNASPRVSVGTPKRTPITPKTPLMASQGGDEDEEEDDDVYQTIDLQGKLRSHKKWKVLALIEWMVFIILIGFLIASLKIHQLENKLIWSLALWKWCVLVVVIFCGRLVTDWLIRILVFLIERNFILKKKVLYFVYGLKKSVQIFLWFGFILLAWILLFHHGVKRSRRATKILNHITMAIAGCLVGAAIWLIKTLLIKILALSYHVNRFFDRIQESLFHQYVLQTLSGPPLMEMAEKIGASKTSGKLSFGHMEKGNRGLKEEIIDIEKLHKMNQEKVSAWTMRGLISVIRGTKLSTISNSLDFGGDDEGSEQNKEINSEWEARAAAYLIFKNVAKPGHKYIEEEDLLRFMKMEEANLVFPLFEGATETGKIKKSTLTKWVVKAYLERKSLAHSLNDTKTAVEELNKIASGAVLIVIIVVWNLMMGFLTTKILVFITSQLLLVVFMFGNTAKTVFEAIIFVFVMHPFDVGDRCVIDGVQMVVEEMNILTTIFLRYDNEKIIYPNSVLATKPISNFYRSPEMSDSVEFSVDFCTSVETIAALKARIKMYIESKPQHWRPTHNIQVKDIENMNKLKMALYVNHTINFQNMGERSSRRSELVIELKRIFEELGIQYHLLPQQVHVSYVGSPSSSGLVHC